MKIKNSHKSRVIFSAMMAILFSLATAVRANPVPDASARSKGGPFGLGVILGDPSGLSAKYFLSDTHALDFAAGFGFSRVEGYQFQMDYLWHPHVLTTTEYFHLPCYVGVGPVIQVVDDDRDNHRDDFGFGVRVPFGLVFALTKVALDPFIEVAPGVEIYGRAGFRIDGATGVRYSF